MNPVIEAILKAREEMIRQHIKPENHFVEVSRDLIFSLLGEEGLCGPFMHYQLPDDVTLCGFPVKVRRDLNGWRLVAAKGENL